MIVQQEKKEKLENLGVSRGKFNIIQACYLKNVIHNIIYVASPTSATLSLKR